jgi:hypothetical protein
MVMLAKVNYNVSPYTTVYISHKLWSFAWPMEDFFRTMLGRHNCLQKIKSSNLLYLSALGSILLCVGDSGIVFFTLSNDRNIYIFKSSLGLLFLASLLWSALTHEPELNSLLQCLHLVPPGMLHNRAWHWLAHDVYYGLLPVEPLHIYI